MGVRFVVNACVDFQRLNISVEVCQKIGSQAFLLVLVKMKSFDEVSPSLLKNLNSHEVSLSTRLLASSQSMNRVLPSAISL